MAPGYLKRKFTYALFSIINRILPKKKRIFIYGGNRLYDNNEAMFTYLLENTEYTIICMATEHKKYRLRDNVKFVPCTNLKALRYMMTSSVQMDSFLHAVRMKPTKKQLFIQMWHGTPLKRIDKTKERDGVYYSKILYPSDWYKKEYMKTFASREEQMFLNGLPRNDYLFKPVLPSFLAGVEGLKILWLPTYRHGFGEEETKSDIPVLNEENVVELDNFLEEKHITLLIKPHPAQQGSLEGLFTNSLSRVRLINDRTLDENNIVLYSFIGAMDALITDYSSVYFDYLLLNRPIGFAIDDIEEYRKNRGFVFDDILEYMPGEKIYDFGDLKLFIDHIQQGTDEYVHERKRVNDLVNHWQDGNNCERCRVLIDNFMSIKKTKST